MMLQFVDNVGKWNSRANRKGLLAKFHLFQKRKKKNVSENRKQVAEELWLYFVEFRNASWGNEDRNSCVLEAKVNAQFS
jgi:hypothetical protein